ncbi:hypothetical protein [Algoriphagus confluentis]|uniref:Uncharacterized protein n=1 Tax=Algoriphagus confluentis TaxID=1697556 RepID=A0ABQ6PTX7_9BACT|nr:hypothetical protein Aconfl_32960 [Algoriphagus confluentis]
MLNEVIQSDWFWPTVGVSLMGYYAWVFLTYFRSGVFQGISSSLGERQNKAGKLQLSWDELALGFAIHRRMLADPLCALDTEERALLGRSPFKELIQQTTI